MTSKLILPSTLVPAPLPERGRGFVAAASVIPLKSVKDVTALARTRQAWQADAFMFNKEVTELGYTSAYIGDTLARVRFFAAEQPDPESDPGVCTLPEAHECLADLEEGEVGLEGIQRDFGQNIVIAGECYLIGLPDGPNKTSWDIYSVDAIQVDHSGKVKIKHGPGTLPHNAPALPDDAFVMRIWRRDPQWARLAYSHYRSLLDIAEAVLIEMRAMRAVARSRMASAGILLLPEQGFPGPIDPNDPTRLDPVQQKLERLMTAALADEGQPSSVVPLVIRLSAEYIEAVKHITFDRAEDDRRQLKLEMLIRRMAQGLPVPPEVILGTADSNHWSAWLTSEETWKGHIEPFALMFANALTTRYLRPYLEETGLSPDEALKYRVWYDASKVVAKPDQTLAADTGHNLGILSDLAWLKAHNFNEEDQADFFELLRRIAYQAKDAATFLQTAQSGDLPEEFQAQMDAKAAEDAALQAQMAQAAVDPATGEQVPAPPGPPASGPPSMAASAESVAKADLTPLADKLHSIDSRLADRLLIAADATLREATNKAGARIRQTGKRDKVVVASLSGVDNSSVASTLGPSVVASLGLSERELVEDTVDSLRDRFHSWTTRAHTSANKAIRQVIASGSTSLSEETLTQHEMDQRADRDSAWAWFREALIAEAVDHFYSPGVVEQEGEWDSDTTVPYDLVREVLARAGGASDPVITDTVTASSSPSSDSLRDPSVTAGVVSRLGTALKRAALATGARIARLLEGTGIVAVSNSWEYGDIPRSTFLPHKRLDGTEFKEWTDSALATDPSHFPYVSHYQPGDHKGCRCWARPRFDWLPERQPTPTPVPVTAAAADWITAEEVAGRFGP